MIIGDYYVVRNKETKKTVKPYSVSSSLVPHLYASENKAKAFVANHSTNWQAQHEVVPVRLVEITKE